MSKENRVLAVALAAVSFALVLMELLLTRLFGVVLFASFAHLALALALMGIGVGAVLQHLWPQLVPEKGLNQRVAWLALLQGGLSVLAVLAVLNFPIVSQFEVPPETYQERSGVVDNLVDPWWFAALLPCLAAPFTAAGLILAGVFQRRREHIGGLYAADLAGGALAAVLFLPLLGAMAGPDLVFLILLASGIAAVVLAEKTQRVLAGALGVLALGASLVSLKTEILEVRYAAGYAEDSILTSLWTPVARVSIADLDRGHYIVLDNSSASRIPQTPADVEVLDGHINRSLVYRFHEPGARVAIMAASAGPEVSVAQLHGHSDITAIDIAGGIHELVVQRYPDAPSNPYIQPGVQFKALDGRAGIASATEPFDIIQMVHANLWSSAGLLSNAWSPALLETREAFGVYLDHLNPEGTLSFGRGSKTDRIARSAAAALRQRGVKRPHQHILVLKGAATVMLVKPRPWTADEVARALSLAQEVDRKTRVMEDPTTRPDGYLRGIVLTDDRPYLDDHTLLKQSVDELFEERSGENEEALAALYRSIVVQSGFVLFAGLLFILVPMLRRGPAELKGVKGIHWGLLYACTLGYGYLSVETVLLHELALFVGHPTFAVTAVILAMLASSGLGSYLAGRIKPDKMLLALRVALGAGLILGVVQGWLLPPLLESAAMTAPLPARFALTVLSLVPLGLVLGMPFPLGMRLLRPEVGGLVPWAWALNGWMSVASSLITVILARMYGYHRALAVALGVYALGLLLAGMLPRIRGVQSEAETA